MATIALSILDTVRIASPCTAEWNSMEGDDVVRRCADCSLEVHNLSAMKREEAEAYLLSVQERLKSERICVRFYRRADGTILTTDCPRGLAVLRAAAASAGRRVGVALALLFGGGVFLGMTGSNEAEVSLANVRPFSTIRAWLFPAAPAAPAAAPPLPFVMGEYRVAPISKNGTANRRPAASGCDE